MQLSKKFYNSKILRNKNICDIKKYDDSLLLKINENYQQELDFIFNYEENVNYFEIKKRCILFRSQKVKHEAKI